jgi:hypothetical protein
MKSDEKVSGLNSCHTNCTAQGRSCMSRHVYSIFHCCSCLLSVFEVGVFLLCISFMMLKNRAKCVKVKSKQKLSADVYNICNATMI